MRRARFSWCSGLHVILCAENDTDAERALG
jgi:hypothetical protein